jgi:branched-chain amino acid transport system permease protein
MSSNLAPDHELENSRGTVAVRDRGRLSPALVSLLTAATAFLVLFPINRSTFTGLMWVWAAVLVAVVVAFTVVPRDSRNGRAANWIAIMGVLAFLIVFPIGRANSTLVDMGLFAVFAIVIIGQNLTQGFAGQITLAQAAFLGVGAYTSVLFDTGREMSVLGVTIDLPDLPFLWTIPIAVFVSMILSVLVGMPALRVSGPWLAFVTLAFNLLVFLVLNNEEQFTGGARGIRVLRDDFTVLGIDMFPTRNFYYLCLVFLILATLIVWWIVHCPWGRAFKAIRDNPGRASSLGIDVRTYTLLAFAIGSGLAGGAGALYARLVEYIEPRAFFINQSFDFLLATVVGGLGTLAGPFIGTSFITVLADRLRFTGDWYRVWFGLFVVMLMLVAPRGIAGSYNQFRVWLQQRRTGDS